MQEDLLLHRCGLHVLGDGPGGRPRRAQGLLRVDLRRQDRLLRRLRLHPRGRVAERKKGRRKGSDTTESTFLFGSKAWCVSLEALRFR